MTAGSNTLTERRGPLAGYRLLDLADEKGATCGKMFADMGADVIKVEPPDGCTTRRIPPFLDGVIGPERSLYHLTYDAGKRSVTLDVRQEQGRQLLSRLAQTADFIVESNPIGYLDSLGLGYQDLAEVNPALIYTSVTPFGDRGPAAGWKATDIVTWAAGGMMFLTGYPGRPPLQMALPQAGLHAGCEAALSSMLAHFERARSGLGQKIIVDMQACVAWTLMNESSFPMLHGDFLRRTGVMSGSVSVLRQTVYRCADGFVSFMLTGGDPFLRTSQEVVRWMEECGAAPDSLKQIDISQWTPRRFATEATPELIKEVRAGEEAVSIFLRSLTRKQLYRRALDYKLLLAPIATVEDICHDEQLEWRQYFQRVEYPALGRELTLVGPFARMSGTPMPRPVASPTLGQHNEEVYCGELGLGTEEFQRLQAERVV